ncbi:MAG: hypothetical protein A4E45_01044 [Methanosaeta sp. PtaB.Bin039]|nr:MAG: hypothetical protein A4E45_01044 [Methanosaeta sp. PtaB.Bin039]
MITQAPINDRINIINAEASQLLRTIEIINSTEEDGVNTVENPRYLWDSTQTKAEGPKIAPWMEDIKVHKTKKTVKSGKTYDYWYACWRDGKKSRTVYLGSCREVSAQVAKERAMEMRFESLFGDD